MGLQRATTRSGVPRQGGVAWKVAVAHARTTGEGDIPDHDFRVTAADGTQRTVAMGGLLFGHNVLVTFVDRTEQQAQTKRCANSLTWTG